MWYIEKLTRDTNKGFAIDSVNETDKKNKHHFLKKDRLNSKVHEKAGFMFLD
jgi:hypothetical protein